MIGSAATTIAAFASPAGAEDAPTPSIPADGLEEIVVTARKSSEDIQKTPISITAFSAERLEAQGITQIDRIQDFTPNLTFANIPSNSGITSNAAIYIRGIGQSDFAPSVDPGVGTYIDGVYLGRSVGGVFDLIDVSSVEVLRGPQGTLFGQNTIGGAINITTLQPNATFHAKADVKYGTDNLANVRVLVSGPIAENLGLYGKISVGTFYQDGYVYAPYLDKELGNKDTQVIRGALRYAPSESRLDVTLAADYTRDRSNGTPFVITGIGNDPSSFINLNNLIASGGTSPSFCFQPAQLNNPKCYNSRLFSTTTNYSTGSTFSYLDQWSSSLTAAYRLTDTVQLKSISAYRRTGANFANDPDGSPVLIGHNLDYFTQEQESEELQMIGKTPDERLNWVTGLYYFKEHGKDINPVEFLVASIQSGGYFDFYNWAAFSQVGYKITSKLTLTGGVRFTEVRKHFLPDQYVESTLAPYLVIPPGTRIVPLQTVAADAQKTNPMANISYQLTDELMAYLNYAQGFKGGGYTQRIFPPEPELPSFKPETANAYEGGMKLLTWNNRLRLNWDVYYTQYKDLQLLYANTTLVGPFIANAGDARIEGFELDSNLAPGAGWRFNAAAGLTDAHYTRLAPGVQDLTLQSTFNYVSKWTLSSSAEKEISLGNAGSLTPHIDWSYRSGFGTNSNGIAIPELYQPGYSVFNGSVRWLTPNPAYYVTAGVDNIGDNKYRTYGDYQPAFGMIRQTFDRGREWIVKAAASF